MQGKTITLQNLKGIYAHLNGAQGKVNGTGLVHNTLRIELEGGTKLFFATEDQIKAE